MIRMTPITNSLPVSGEGSRWRRHDWSLKRLDSACSMRFRPQARAGWILRCTAKPRSAVRTKLSTLGGSGVGGTKRDSNRSGHAVVRGNLPDVSGRVLHDPTEIAVRDDVRLFNRLRTCVDGSAVRR